LFNTISLQVRIEAASQHYQNRFKAYLTNFTHIGPATVATELVEAFYIF